MDTMTATEAELVSLEELLARANAALGAAQRLEEELGELTQAARRARAVAAASARCPETCGGHRCIYVRGHACACRYGAAEAPR